MSLTPIVTIKEYNRYPGILVETRWQADEPLDRDLAMGYVFGIHDQALAERMKAAIEAGAIFTDPHIVRDTSGQTYVKHDVKVWGKYADKDLKKLGF